MREGQILAGLEEMELFLEQQGIGAEIDVLLARTRPSTILSISGCISGSPPGIENHWSAALIHGFETSSGLNPFSKCARILDLSRHQRKQVAAESGSSISKMVALTPP